jgi:transposase
MIPIPSGVRVWISTGVTDMRRGMNGLSLQVPEAFGRDPHLCVGRYYVAEAPRRHARAGRTVLFSAT